MWIGLYPYVNMDGWEKFNETFLQSLKYGRYHWCRLCACEKCLKHFEIKNLGGYHDLHIQSDCY